MRVLETAYQLINYDDEDTQPLIHDLMLRYGEEYGVVYDKAWELIDNLGMDIIKRISPEFIESIMSRMRGMGNALYLLRLVGFGGDEGVLRAQFRLSGLGEGYVEDLIRVGALMHRSRNLLFTPEYLLGSMVNVVGELPKPNIPELLGKSDPLSLSVLEAVAFNLRIINWMYRAIHGVDFKEALIRARINGLLESVDGEPVLNPVVEPQEVRLAIYEAKDSGARYIKRVIAPHGQYIFSRLIRCGVVYTVFGGAGRELIILCPWVTPSVGLMKYHSNEDRVIVTTQKPSEHFINEVNEHINELPQRTGFVFIEEGGAWVMRPRYVSKSFDSFLDFLYRSNLVVNYLD